MVKRIVGGPFNFPLAVPSEQAKKLLSPENGLYVNARSAMFAITRVKAFSRVWLPSFLCSSVVDPFEKAGIDIYYYPVSRNLSVTLGPLDIRAGDGFVLIAYFGISHAAALYRQLREKELCIIEDLSQAVFAEPNPLADYSVYSPRKYFPVPDGGVVLSNREASPIWPYEEKQPTEQFYQAVEAHACRTLFEGGLAEARHWHENFQCSESLMSTGLQPMSDFAKSLLLFTLDLEAERAGRVENFDYLAQRLERCAVMRRNSSDVPLGFPVVCKERDRIRNKLFEHGIFPPIHWEISDFVPERFRESHELAQQIMTLPCDARYGREDLERMVRLIEDENGEP